jgi:hypothetical protein
MSFHHYAGIFYYIGAMITGYGCLSVTVVGLIVEISTILLNVRALQPSSKTPCFKFLSYSFFFSFTVLRIFFFPYLFLMVVATVVGLWSRLNLLRRIASVIYGLISLSLIGLMFFWYYQMVFMLLKLLGCVKKKKGEIDETRGASTVEEMDVDDDKKQ